MEFEDYIIGKAIVKKLYDEFESENDFDYDTMEDLLLKDWEIICWMDYNEDKVDFNDIEHLLDGYYYIDKLGILIGFFNDKEDAIDCFNYIKHKMEFIKAIEFTIDCCSYEANHRIIRIEDIGFIIEDKYYLFKDGYNENDWRKVLRAYLYNNFQMTNEDYQIKDWKIINYDLEKRF